jgi:hypothetical protein
VGWKLIFLVVLRAMSLIRLSHREPWWKGRRDLDAPSARCRAAARPRVQSRLTWPDRAWLALLAGTLPNRVFRRRTLPGR